MIQFKELIIEGFGSICNELSLDLSDNGVYIVRGKNGSGKTTLFNAFIWCLYGINLKGVKISELVTKEEFRTHNFRGTRVVLEFTKNGIHYIVARHIKYKGKTLEISGGSQLLVWKNGELIDAQHKDDSQKYIEEILEINSSVFLSSVLFGQRMKRFIEASPTEKRELFESIFDLSYIDNAKDNALKEKNSIEGEINSLENQNHSLKVSIDSKNRMIVQIKQQIETFEKIKQDQIIDLKRMIEKNQDALKTLQLKEVEELYEIESPETSINSIELDLSRYNIELKSLVVPKEINKLCNTCGNELNEAQVTKLKKDYEEDLKAYKNLKNSLEETIQGLIKEKSALEEHIAELKIFEEHNALQIQIGVENKLIQKSIDTCNSNISSYNEQIEKIQLQELGKSQSDIDSLIKEIEQDELSIEKNNNLLGEYKDVLEVVEWWYKVGFSSKGLKGYILNSALTLLNKSIHKYSSRLGFRIKFSIDTSKASKPFITQCFNGDVELSYNEFSGGEKARIDVATAFAMHDLVSSNIVFNTLIMDEIFEGLDNDGIEDVFDLIRMKGEGKSLYVITHSEQIDSLNTKRIDVYKTDSTYLS